MSFKLSLCITTYNRPELTIEAFEKVYNDPRIDEIVILDDHSEWPLFDALKLRCDRIANGTNKIRLERNMENIGMSLNKKSSIEIAKNDWCILFDSDNVLDTDYLDAFYKIIGDDYPISNIIYCPTFAKPDFNYTSLSHKVFTGKMIGHEIMQNNALNMAMNTCNYIVNKRRYLKFYKPNDQHIASDTIWFNYNWMQNGGCFYFVPNMEYYHRVHKESGFLQNAEYNIQQAEKVRKLISCL